MPSNKATKRKRDKGVFNIDLLQLIRDKITAIVASMQFLFIPLEMLFQSTGK